jgi:hypothetical protein
MNPVCDAGKSIVQTLFDQGYGKVSNIYAYPLALQLLRGVYGSSAPAERIKWLGEKSAFKIPIREAVGKERLLSTL